MSGDALEEATLQQRSRWGGDSYEGRKECSRKRQEWVEGPAVGGNSVKYENLERKSVGWSPESPGGRRDPRDRLEPSLCRPRKGWQNVLEGVDPSLR